MDCTRSNKIETLAYIFCLESYQNEDSAANYMPFLSGWVDEVLEKNLTELKEMYRDQEDVTEEDYSDFLLYNPDPDNPKDWKLALMWANYIIGDPEKLKILENELYEYFFWHGEMAEFYYWLPGCGFESPEKALEVCSEFFGWKNEN